VGAITCCGALSAAFDDLQVGDLDDPGVNQLEEDLEPLTAGHSVGNHEQMIGPSASAGTFTSSPGTGAPQTDRASDADP